MAILVKNTQKSPLIAGAAVLMTRKRYWEMGGLDEHLFFYNDDIDMCKTLKKLGYPIYYCPDSQLIHLEDYQHSLDELVL